MKPRSRAKHRHDLIRAFLHEHSDRPTRLGVFRPEYSGVTDYWLESGLPLNGLDLDEGPYGLRLTITLGDMRREIGKVSSIALRLGPEDEGLDVVDEGGSMTILRFEKVA
jgi:hypothetical protein